MRRYTRSLAFGMAALTAFGTVATTTVTAHAEPVEEVAEGDGLGDPFTGMGQALIKKGVGQIPVIGDVLSELIDPLFGELFGGDGDFKALSEQISSLALKMDEDTQKILAQMYEQGLDGFNENITSIREIELKLMDRIASIRRDTNLTDVDKCIQIGLLLDVDATDTGEFVNKLNTCAAYVQGTQTAPSKTEGGIFQKAFNLKCRGVKLGGEAAIKAKDYVSSVDAVIENGYKLEAMIVDSKIVAAESLRNMSEKDRTDTITFLKGKYSDDLTYKRLLNMCYLAATAEHPETDSIMDGWKTAAGTVKDGVLTGAKAKYELICNDENPSSVVSKYNAMVTDTWYSYIEKAIVDGNAMDVTFLPLSSKLEGADYKDLRLEQFKNTSNLGVDPDYVANAIRNRFNMDPTRDFPDKNKIDPRRTDVLCGPRAKEVLDSLQKLPQYKDKTAFEILKDYGFDVTTTLKKNCERYGVAEEAVNNLTDAALLDATKPIIVYDAYVPWNKEPFSMKLTANMDGKNLATNADATTTVLTSTYGRPNVLDPTYHKLLGFNYAAPNPVKLTAVEADNNVNDAELDAQIEAGFKITDDTSAIDKLVADNNDNTDADNTADSIVLTVDENGQISGDQMNEAWTVAEDGTIILNKDNKFRFEGTVADKNIQNYGEIVDGNFKNVKLELVDNAVITKGTFEDCEITTNENAVIGEEVELINTTIIDANNIENKEEEEQKEDPQEVVEETPVSENDMF